LEIFKTPNPEVILFWSFINPELPRTGSWNKIKEPPIYIEPYGIYLTWVFSTLLRLNNVNVTTVKHLRWFAGMAFIHWLWAGKPHALPWLLVFR
jgi:hypothetical protein